MPERLTLYNIDTKIESKQFVGYNVSTSMSQQEQQLLKQELSVSQILRVYGKQFTQITQKYSDGYNGRCALGVIMSFYGWDGEVDSRASKKLLRAFIALSKAGLNKDLVIQLNDSGMSFDEIADYLDHLHELTLNDLVEY